jgi:N-acyl-D-aspartate/D-glutamate deacylase
MILFLSKVLNSWLFKGNMVFQALSAPFKVYGDGATCPLMEEADAFRELISEEIEDEESRRKVMADPAFVQRFKTSWNKGKTGFGIKRLTHKLNIDPDTFNRELKDIYIDTVPFEAWNGLCLLDVFGRVKAYQQSGGAQGYTSQDEKEMLEKFPANVEEADIFLTLLQLFDRQFRWHTTTANYRKEVLRKLVFHPQTLPGFNDSGAHLTNMAFYDGNLRTLQLAQEESIDLVSKAVSRLTREPAKLFGLDVGELKVGAKADIAVFNPQALSNYDSDENTQMAYREQFEQEQMVNRSDGVVEAVVVAGKVAWDGKAYLSAFGQEKYGDLLLKSA